MKIYLVYLLLFLVAVLGGCKPEPRDKTHDSERMALSLMPQIQTTYEQTQLLVSQNKWLRQSLDRCIKRLEIERNLEPITIKHPLPIIGDPNFSNVCPSKHEPWFVAYERPVIEPLADESAPLKILKALMGINSVSLKHHIAYTDGWIDNFEERMKRLEKHLEK